MNSPLTDDTPQMRKHTATYPGYPIVGVLPEMARDILGTYREAARQGDIVVMNLGLGPAYLLHRPEHMRYVLQTNHTNYIKGNRFDSIRPILGNGLFVSDGDFWQQQRKVMQPAFHRPVLANLTQTMVDGVQMVMDRWADILPTKPVNMMTEMRQITQTVIVEATFSTSISRGETEAAGDALDFALSTLVERSIIPLYAPEWIPTKTNRKLKRSLDILNEVVYRFIDERRALIAASEDGIDPTGDMLAMLMNTRYEDTGEGMSDDVLRDEVMTMFLAGHETTATTLSWVFALLNEYPEVEAKLHAEVDSVLGGRTPTFDDLRALPYTRQIIDETLRLYPPVWMTSREAVNEDVIDGYYIPRGATLMLGFYLLHSNPEFWEEPDRWNPDRFSPEQSEGRDRYTYLPFGRGPRTCIGEHFGLMEAQIVLAMIASKYRPQLVGSRESLGVRPMGTLQPLKGPHMMLVPR